MSELSPHEPSIATAGAARPAELARGSTDPLAERRRAFDREREALVQSASGRAGAFDTDSAGDGTMSAANEIGVTGQPIIASDNRSTSGDEEDLVPEKRLAFWQAEIAREARQGHGIDALQRVLSKLKKEFGEDEAFLPPAIDELQHCADRHLSENYAPQIIEAIFEAIFPGLNSDLNDATIRLDAESEIERLAKLPLIERARARKSSAAKLGITVGTLDRLVANLLATNEAAQDFLPHWAVTPCAEKVDGAVLLDHLCQYLKRYVILTEHAAEALALWILHTWVFNCFDVTPYLSITSPTKRCGKTVLMTLLYWLCCRAKKSDSMSRAAIYRSVERDKPTLCLDEVSWVLDLRDERQGILCGGYERNGFVEVCEGEGTAIRTRLFSTFCPKAFGLIGRLTGTLTDRSIVIPMRRKTSIEKVERLRRRDNDAQKKLRQQCLRWANDNSAALAKAAPIALDKLNDREVDFWEPLATIALQAGGEWPKKAHAAAIALSTDGAATSGDGECVELLHDIKAAFDSSPERHAMFTRTLISILIADEERPWAAYSKTGRPITDRKIAELLGGFGVISGTVRIGDATAKGYKLADFEEAWRRYPKPEFKDSGGKVANAFSRPMRAFQASQRHNVNGARTSDDLSSVTEPRCDGGEKGDSSNNDGHCDGVTVCADVDEREGSWTV